MYDIPSLFAAIVLSNASDIYNIYRLFLHLQSLHDAAEFHAIARAVGGCPVYVRCADVLL